MCRTVVIPAIKKKGVSGIFYGLDFKKGNGRLGKLVLEVARLAHDEEKD